MIGYLFQVFFSVIGFLTFSTLLLFIVAGTSLIELWNVGFNIFEFWDILINSQNEGSGNFWKIPLVFTLLIYLIYQMLIVSMLVGGLYGSSIHAIYEKQASIGAYFSYSFRNLGKIFRLQFLLLLLSIPVIVFLFIFNIGLQSLFLTDNIIYFQVAASLLLLILTCTIFLHSPIFIIKEKQGAWQSFMQSLQLLQKDWYPILISGTFFFGTLLLLNGLFLGLCLFLLSILDDISLFTFQFESLGIGSMFVAIICLLLWISIVFPYSAICALLRLVDRYQKHLSIHTKSHPDQTM